jgi:hypothetical protein
MMVVHDVRNSDKYQDIRRMIDRAIKRAFKDWDMSSLRFQEDIFFNPDETIRIRGACNKTPARSFLCLC